MKNALLLTALLPAMSLAESPANLLKNGDFEAEPSIEKIYTFKQTSGWYNRAKVGIKQDANARTSEGKLEGSNYSAAFNDGGEDVSSFVQKTEHTITEGDVFEVSLDWVAGWKWQSQDVLHVIVFATTNNTLGGQKLWEEAVDFERAPTGSFEKVNHTFPPAPADAEGRLLYFGFYGLDPAPSGTTGFARLDNIVLTVKPK